MDKEHLNIKQVVSCIEAHQQWRLGNLEENPMSPRALTIALDDACMHIKEFIAIYEYLIADMDFIKKNSDFYDANFYESESYYKGFNDALLQIADIIDARLQ